MELMSLRQLIWSCLVSAWLISARSYSNGIRLTHGPRGLPIVKQCLPPLS